MRGYVPLRRGILDHLPNMSGLACKVYISLLCIADHRTGEASFSQRSLSELVGADQAEVSRAMKELATPLPGREEGYIRWVYKSRSRHHDSRVEVTRFRQGKPSTTDGDGTSVTPPVTDGLTDGLTDGVTDGNTHRYTTSDLPKGASNKGYKVEKVEKEVLTPLLLQVEGRIGRPLSPLEVKRLEAVADTFGVVEATEAMASLNHPSVTALERYLDKKGERHGATARQPAGDYAFFVD